MNEQDWLSCTNPVSLVESIRSAEQASERKLRLCVLAWARSILHHAPQSPRGREYRDWLSGPQWLPQLEAAERFADGQVDRKVLRASRLATGGPYNVYRLATAATRFTFAAAWRAVQFVQAEFRIPHNEELCAIARCVFGPPPFTRAGADPAFLVGKDGLIVRLAQAAHENRLLPSGQLDSDRLVVLADALEEAGCMDAEMLCHLRDPGPHVRGCHALDAVLSGS
jgi:hypothetical protein